MQPSAILLLWESFNLLKDNIRVIINTLFVAFDITVNIFVCMCGINVVGHTCHEYSVLV
jgi:hypothetical protein